MQDHLQVLGPDSLLTFALFVCTGTGLTILITAAIFVVPRLFARPQGARHVADRASRSHCRLCGIALPPDAPQGLCPRCLLQAAIDEPTVPPPPGAPYTVAYQPGVADMPPAQLAGHFPQIEILELLGKGGMGAVYKARQPNLDRFVALKVLPPETARDPAFAERFQREARALARLSHPNIIGVHDFGQQDGLYYLMMEYVDGVNLRQAMRSGQLTPEEALRVVPQICDALQFAHDEGIVHRDIKPENILLDRRGRVKIADFGLAKLRSPSADDVRLTGTQQVMGTMHYMAPEQLASARTVDHRADIYALGVTFYEMLTGELPVGRFPPPSKKAPIDARLDQIVLRTLEHAPADRYQHASDIKTEVESVLSGAPGAASDLNIALPAPPIPGRFWATPQPGYASWVGIPMLVLVGLYLLASCALLFAAVGGGPFPHRAVSWDAVGTVLCIGPLLLAGTFAVLNLVWAARRRRSVPPRDDRHR